MKLGREVSRHNELDNWRNTHRFESVMATKWLLLTISETEPGLWDRLIATAKLGSGVMEFPLIGRDDWVTYEEAVAACAEIAVVGISQRK